MYLLRARGLVFLQGVTCGVLRATQLALDSGTALAMHSFVAAKVAELCITLVADLAKRRIIIFFTKIYVPEQTELFSYSRTPSEVKESDQCRICASKSEANGSVERLSCIGCGNR